jgi:glucose/arabinose dehydrogenase
LRSLLALACLCALGVACAADASTDAKEQGQFRLRTLATGFDSPLYVTGAKGEPGRLYVVEQGGTIRIFERGRIRSETFLDIRSRVTAGGEQGLLGLAFHPSWPRVRKFYVQYTDRGESTQLVEYRAGATRAIPGSGRRLFFSRDPYGNHNGGMLAFAPNGRLLFTMGDGGAGGDPENRSQDPRSLFGKLLSINVATKGLKIEAYGLRNAWRFSFDRANNDLYIADVGQGNIEEVNWIPANSPGVENYGWDVYEGRSRYESKALGPGKLVQPVAQYTHSQGCSITGGYVYRGSNASLRGRYIYGDYCSGYVWSFKLAGGKATGLRRERFRIENLTSFGQDLDGELYGVSGSGTIYRLTP